jgi:hypothetical protein
VRQCPIFLDRNIYLLQPRRLECLFSEFILLLRLNCCTVPRSHQSTMAPTTRLRASARLAYKNGAKPVSIKDIKPVKLEVLETASLSADSKSLPSPESKSERATKPATKPTRAMAGKHRRKQKKSRKGALKKVESVEEEEIIKEESGKPGSMKIVYERKKPRRPARLEKPNATKEPEGFWLCRKHKVWIDSSHPLW